MTNLSAEVAAQVPMHRVAARTGPHHSDVGTTAAPQPPIGRYRRVLVQVHQADPDAPEVARRLFALIATRWPATPAEHVGSSAVPGLAGKGIIDLLLTAQPAHILDITKALLELGFQPQRPAAFPPTRPMLWGTFRHGTREYRVHVHVVPAGSPEVAAMRGLRDALRADPVLRRRYAAQAGHRRGRPGRSGGLHQGQARLDRRHPGPAWPGRRAAAPALPGRPGPDNRDRLAS